MTQDLFSLEGRRALVTGAAKGIGAQLAAGLAAAGADMVLWGRSAQSLHRHRRAMPDIWARRDHGGL